MKKNRFFLVLLGIVLVIATAFWVWYSVVAVQEFEDVDISNSEFVSSSTTQSAVDSTESQFSDIEFLLGTVPAQFIPYISTEDRQASLSQELQDITAFAGRVLLGDRYIPGDETSGVSVLLLATAPRYIVATVLSPKDVGSNPEIIDTKTQVSTPLPGYIEFTVGNVAVIASDDTIYTYKLGAARAVPVSGTTLPKGESYDHCLGGCMSSKMTQTHSTTTATFTVWRWSSEEDAPVKSRDITFSLMF